MTNWWKKLFFGRRDESTLSPAEKRFEHESVDDRGAEGFVEEHLGGGDPGHRPDDEDLDFPRD